MKAILYLGYISDVFIPVLQFADEMIRDIAVVAVEVIRIVVRI